MSYKSLTVNVGTAEGRYEGCAGIMISGSGASVRVKVENSDGTIRSDANVGNTNTILPITATIQVTGSASTSHAIIFE